MWPNTDTALHCEQWYETPQGSYAFAREKLLLRRMLSSWPRRGHSLLEVGCGTGRFLECFWEAGFDVTGLACNPTLLDMARTRMGGRVDIQVAAPDHLPFDDNTFAYVALMAPLPAEGPPPYAILREAVRVAAGGVLVRFWSSCSLMGLCRLLPWSKIHDLSHGTQWLTWREYRALLRTLSPGCALSTGSILLGAPCSWRDGLLYDMVNKAIVPLPLGGVVMLRMEHPSARPMTGLPLYIQNLHMQGVHPAAVLERTDGNSPPAEDGMYGGHP